MKEKVITLEGQEMVDFVNNFEIFEEKFDNGSYLLDSTLEKIRVRKLNGFSVKSDEFEEQSEIIEFDKSISTEMSLVDHEFKYNGTSSTKRTIVSNQYDVLPTSKLVEILFRDVLEAKGLMNKVENIKLFGNGGIILNMVPFKDLNITDTQVTDFVRYDSIEDIYENCRHIKNDQYDNIYKTNFGDYHITFLLNNSYNKSKSVTLKLGVFRLVCTNGLVVPVNMGILSNKKGKDVTINNVKHFKSTNILEKTKAEMYKIPEYYNNFNSINKISQIKTNSAVLLDMVKDFGQNYTKYNYSSKTQKEHRKNIEDKGSTIIRKIIETEKINTLLDFENITSYLSNSTRVGSNDKVRNGFTNVSNNYFPELRKYVSTKLTTPIHTKKI